MIKKIIKAIQERSAGIIITGTIGFMLGAMIVGSCIAICDYYKDDYPYLSKNFNWEDVEPEAVIYYYGNDKGPWKGWHKIIAEPGKAYVMMGLASMKKEPNYPSIFPNSPNYVELRENGELWTFYKED